MKLVLPLFITDTKQVIGNHLSTLRPNQSIPVTSLRLRVWSNTFQTLNSSNTPSVFIMFIVLQTAKDNNRTIGLPSVFPVTPLREPKKTYNNRLQTPPLVLFFSWHFTRNHLALLHCPLLIECLQPVRRRCLQFTNDQITWMDQDPLHQFPLPRLLWE